MADIEIPGTINDVTPEWLGDVLALELKGMQVTQIGQGVGIMGDIYRVQPQLVSGGATPSVVVKLPSSFEENRAQGVALGMFAAEVRFYNELAPRVPVGLPHVYCAAIEPGTANFVIVMEDLCDLEMADQVAGMTQEQALAAVKVLAHVHAVWWDQAEDEALTWIPSMTGPRIEFVDTLLNDLIEPFSQMFADHLPPRGLEIYRGFAGNYLRINKVLAGRSPWTLVHQDFRVENMLFGPDSVKVIDWQGIGRGPGAYDLAYILGGSMAPELRRECERECVQAYLDVLLAQGLDGYTFAQLWDDYGHAQLMGGLATSMVVGAGMDLNNERGKALAITMASRHVTAALDHDGLERLADI